MYSELTVAVPFTLPGVSFVPVPLTDPIVATCVGTFGLGNTSTA